MIKRKVLYYLYFFVFAFVLFLFFRFLYLTIYPYFMWHSFGDILAVLFYLLVFIPLAAYLANKLIT